MSAARGIEGPSTVPSTQQLAGLLRGRNNIHAHVEMLLDPFALVASAFGCALLFEGGIDSRYLALALVVATLTFPGRSRLHLAPARLVVTAVCSTLALLMLLVAFGWATGFLGAYSGRAILGWFLVAPTFVVLAHVAFRASAPLVLSKSRRCVIVGMNEQGAALASRIKDNPYAEQSVVGFFDDRMPSRRVGSSDIAYLGPLAAVADYASRHPVHVIYVSLPMATQERTTNLLAALGDTTASVYFVLDQFVTESIQSRTTSVVDIPVVAVCETPFVGVNGLLKRTVDIVVSALALVCIFPLLLLIALAIRLDSKGPTIFVQRRYGLDGEEIAVYKFRSMLVSENGEEIRQARRDDERITRTGRFLRRTSLDELPQLVNVLQGRMSLVGPRPHAVAHNELYRKQIRRYMVRHKVRPGITGWAQVNGFRGETETVDKMESRIRYDLDYLRNWSPSLDFYILAKTVLLIVRDRQAY